MYCRPEPETHLTHAGFRSNSQVPHFFDCLDLVSDVFGLGEADHLPPSPLLPPHPGVSPSHTSKSRPATTSHSQLESIQQLNPWSHTQIYTDQLVVL